jgi:hypothetical protein
MNEQPGKDFLDDDEIEWVFEAGFARGEADAHALSMRRRENPYPRNDPRAEIWASAWRQGYAKGMDK